MSQKIFRWLCFSVLVALTPIFFNYLGLLTMKLAPSLNKLLSNGELLLITASMTATAIGEIILSGRNKALMKISACFGCVICLLISALYFAFVSSLTASAKTFDPMIVSWVSIGLYIIAFISSTACVVLSEA